MGGGWNPGGGWGEVGTPEGDGGWLEPPREQVGTPLHPHHPLTPSS
jgi:hypothetical protein